MGEKTGWSYIEIPAAIAQQLKPNYKKSFRVKGKWMTTNLAKQVCCPWAKVILLFL